eukprot:31349-Pelagococcus_subviridis.AAC.4
MPPFAGGAAGDFAFADAVATAATRVGFGFGFGFGRSLAARRRAASSPRSSSRSNVVYTRAGRRRTRSDRRRSSRSIAIRARFSFAFTLARGGGEGVVVSAFGRSPTSARRIARLRAIRASRFRSYSVNIATNARADGRADGRSRRFRKRTREKARGGGRSPRAEACKRNEDTSTMYCTLLYVYKTCTSRVHARVILYEAEQSKSDRGA